MDGEISGRQKQNKKTKPHILQAAKTNKSKPSSCSETVKSRDVQVRELKQRQPDLYARVCYWVSDILQFQDAIEECDVSQLLLTHELLLL